MKKKFLLFLICVAIAATSLIALVACKDEAPVENDPPVTPDPPAVVYADPTEFFTAYLASANITIKVFEDPEDPYIGSLNDKGELVYGDIIAKYSDNDLWIYSLSNGIWVKAKIDHNSKKYKELLSDCKSDFYEFAELLKERDFVEKEDKYWYVVDENGDVDAQSALKIEDNKLKSYFINEVEKTLYNELTIGAEINLPKGAESAKVVDVGEILGYDNPYSFYNGLMQANDYTISLTDTSLQYSMNHKGEFEVNGLIGKFEGDEFWVYSTMDRRKAKVDMKGTNYLLLKATIANLKLAMCLQNGSSREDFVLQEDGKWILKGTDNKYEFYGDYSMKVAAKEGRFVLKLRSEISNVSPADYEVVTEEELFA